MVNAGKLDSFRRIHFAVTPTPLEPLENLGRELGIPNLWVKRDDLTGFAGGGNKARKLDWLIADAQDKGCDYIVTTGGRQSNHCRMTAAAASKLGMGCSLVLGDPDPGNRAGNLIMDVIFGANLVFIGEANLEQMQDGIDAEIARLRSEGKNPYMIPVGGATPLGGVAFVDAAREFARQIEGRNIDTLVIAVGSAGTSAGLALGLKIFAPHVRLVSISVSRSIDRLRQYIADKANASAELMETPIRVTPDDYELHDDYIGPKYGVPSDGALEAIYMTGRTEGLLLDPVYTGKAMAGLIDLARQGRFANSKGVAFWHTGGFPSLFAFENEVAAYKP